MASTRSFICDESQLPRRGTIQVVGRTGSVATDDQAFLDILQNLYPSSLRLHAAAFSLQVFVHNEPSLSGCLPHFRGMHHLVFAEFGPSNLFVIDILTRSITAAVTRELAYDRAFWQERLLPIAVGVLGSSIGVLPLHAACLSVDGKGLLIAGVSGTGKSTLSLALAKNGAHFISDDWSYLTFDNGTLRTHGLSAPIKLLPDVVQYFPELRKHELRISLNGELAYELPPGDGFTLQVEAECNPDILVFYERVLRGDPDLTRLSGDQAHDYIQSSIEPLPPQLSWVADQRQRIAARVAELPCWRFRHSGSPQLAAQALRTFLAPHDCGVGS